MRTLFTQPVDSFRHEALLYAGMDDFLAGTMPFLLGGIEAGEAVLVVESAAKISLLRAELGGDGDSVMFADMSVVGANPARIIPAWRDFVTENGGGGRRLRGIGEPIWKERAPVQLIECQRHESLLNVAFAPGQPWWLLCPYDTEALDPSVIDEARRSHEFVTAGNNVKRSDDYRGLDASGAPFDLPLPEPGPGVQELAFDAGSLVAMRGLVSVNATGAGLSPSRAGELVLAVNEVVTNSLVHGGGKGTLRIWRHATGLTCEVRDPGRFHSPLVDRERPAAGAAGSRGLWLANQLCDLVQIRNFRSGTAVRLHMWLGTPTGHHQHGSTATD
jgi:anti-sigma regulatory factor (Ser/Thr protein kinase)